MTATLSANAHQASGDRGGMMILDFFRNETAIVSGIITAATGLLTGPVFQMDAAAVGSITAVVVAVFNLWVRFSVYSKQGAVNVATAAATETARQLTDGMVGAVGEVTTPARALITDVVADVVNPLVRHR